MRIDESVAIAEATVPSQGPDFLLGLALNALDAQRLWAGSDRTRRVLILVDLGAFEPQSPILPSRIAIEFLIDRLAALGFSDIAIASSPDSSSAWAENRAVPVLADLFGYVYRTAAGTNYDIVDLSADLVDAGFPVGSPLCGWLLSREWLEAEVRLVFAKASTDQTDMLWLGARTLCRAFPAPELALAFVDDDELARSLAALLEHTPVSLSIVDLHGVAHGSGGRAAPLRSPSAAMVVGSDLLTVDAAAAAKMGADPSSSQLSSRLAACCGPRSPRPVMGNLRPIAHVELPDSSLVRATRSRDSSPFLARLVPPWLQTLDTSLFPLIHPIDAKVHDRIAPLVAEVGDNPSIRWALILLSYALTAVDAWIEAWRINYDKDLVTRRHAPVSVETLACTAADYRRMGRELDTLKAWLDSNTPPTDEATALRWKHLDGAVVFECVRDYPVPFEEFAARVDIARGIQFMNDYLGGTIEVLRRDPRGRPRRQVERNLYLTQPNYLAWWGGKPIDVSKIESVHYSPKKQRLVWKTITSENDTATRDDGVLTFLAVGAHVTRVRIFGCQHFKVPPLIDALNLERWTGLHDALVEHAYATFFSRTFANFEALLEGRDIAIGRSPFDPSKPAGARQRPIDAIANGLGGAVDWLGPILQRLLQAEGAARMPRVEEARLVLDDDGFTHFKPSINPPPDGARHLRAPWSDWVDGYIEAVARDLAVARARTGDGAVAGAHSA